MGGEPEYIIGSPLFEEVVMELKNGGTLEFDEQIIKRVIIYKKILILPTIK